MDVNKALITKWAWRFKSEPRSSWRRIIEAIHGGRGRWSFLPVNNGLVGCWKNIVSLVGSLKLDGKDIHNLIRGKVGNGADICFWSDLWYGDSILMQRWPKLYLLENQKRCVIRDRITLKNGEVCFDDKWRSGLTSVEEISEYRDLLEMLPKCAFSGGKDTWCWETEKNNIFSVKDVKRILRKDRDVKRNSDMVWTGWVPLKVNIHVWRLEMDRLPTKLALRSRNINVGNEFCAFCQSEEESALHLFTGCILTIGIWHFIERWCHLDPIFLLGIKDILKLPDSIHDCKWKKIIRGIVMTACWVIWKTRNKAIFEEVQPRVCDMIACIKSCSYLWFRSRSKIRDISWQNWCRYLLYML
ncbi:putative reverse transcriptase zinc-binding domain-containing protein [Helianthus annuus]|nr:putative reverse transcriptase zinc-binding domain-containing protein [Helianthus annuus]KAJ0707625.1 putative reverse transcriptase zinc-binding domain-containing protein [Helianthus annuus]